MNKSYGFTLIELMITLAIVAIVLAIGVPSFQGMMRDNRVAAHTNDFLGSLNLARSEAIKRGQRVALAPNAVGNWGQGWTIFVDADNDGVLDAGEIILRRHEPFQRNASLQQTSGSTLRNYISFASNGATRLTNDGLQMGILVLSLCNSQNQQVSIAINGVGRAQVTKGAATITCTD